MTKFRTLRLHSWRQFDDIDIHLHPRLTVLTGANGAGKSTLLTLISRHFGWTKPFLATPTMNKEGVISYFQGFFNTLRSLVTRGPEPRSNIGAITYDNGLVAILSAPEGNEMTYDIEVQQQQPIDGFHIGSHRALPNYARVGQISSTGVSPIQAYHNYSTEVLQEFTEGRWNRSPLLRMKEALIAMAVFGEGNKYVQPNIPIREAYDGFIEKLKQLLPEAIGFQGIDIRMPDIVLKTRTGEFLLDASSGGLHSIIETAWRIYLFSLQQRAFVVTFDEPENHLHPSMQRSFLADLVKTFDEVQFVVATHSPFMVSAVKDSNVYVLQHAHSDAVTPNQETGAALPAERTVKSLFLDTVNKAGSASAILREALGVPSTIPDWVEEDIRGIVTRYSEREFSPDMLEELRSELTKAGLNDLYPRIVADVARIHDQTP